MSENKTFSVQVSTTSAKKIGVSSNVSENPITATADTGLYYSQLAKNWAIGEGLIENTDYSSKAYAQESKAYALDSKAYSETARLDLENLDNKIIEYEEQLNDTVATGLSEISVLQTDSLAEIEANKIGALSSIETNLNNATNEINTNRANTLAQISTLANTSISDINAVGNSYNNLTHKNITNCLLEVPQRIKLELNNGVLTLKAGSEVIVPNGFEADGTTPKFDYVIIESDVEGGTGAGEYVYAYMQSINSFGATPKASCVSGSTTPTTPVENMYWYDTTNNIMKRYVANVWVGSYSLPVCVSSNTTIAQVFNGLGYIGSTIWVDKGVKGLIPNGRNEDGSLKNIERLTPNLIVRTLTTQNGDICVGSNLDNAIGLYSVTGFVQDEVNNLNTNNHIIISKITATTGVITSFNPKQPFRAVNYNDKPEISGWGMPSNKYIDLTLGASGTTYTAPANGWVIFCKQSKNTNQNVCIYKNNKLWSTSWSTGTTNNIAVNAPVLKGETIQVEYTAAGSTQVFRFIYAEGEV